MISDVIQSLPLDFFPFGIASFSHRNTNKHIYGSSCKYQQKYSLRRWNLALCCELIQCIREPQKMDTNAKDVSFVRNNMAVNSFRKLTIKSSVHVI